VETAVDVDLTLPAQISARDIFLPNFEKIRFAAQFFFYDAFFTRARNARKITVYPSEARATATGNPESFGNKPVQIAMNISGTLPDRRIATLHSYEVM